jgi:tRNA(Ser,Leu) C12 N-acetylase TAN1
MPEEPEEAKKEEKEKKEEEQEEQVERSGKVKHESLKDERAQEARHKEKFRDFKKSLTKKGKHLFDRKRKDKFIGGTRGRRGG